MPRLIDFESGWNPTIENPLVKKGKGSARGLIQIIDKSARSLGFKGSLDAIKKYPNISEQLTYVVFPYLRQFRPFKDKKSLYLSVFYPAYRNKPGYTKFPENVQKVNPGIVTVQDYINKVDKKNFSFSLTPIILVGGAFLIFRKVFYGKGKKHT